MPAAFSEQTASPTTIAN
ncbi:unnamed protein product [Spirodela intermedia]|uniref:Uncharacterized protein n=2 Tax=Spirodela intermedia TaxID=51605 RepID=A0A7I8ID37_SPIIN|nr:unnamed protein product [Spirodela intermedia]CAA6655676.1 unnamed protein product [Spirodela intermedia]CAA7391009.1 unnamed protein product [Spirodela intermedia]